MLDDVTYAHLRRGAALVHAVPDARLTVTADGEEVLVVADPFGRPAGTTACSPCGFRRAVITAMGHHRAGRRMALLGLVGADLGLELRLGPGGTVVDGDLVLSRIGDRVVGIVATTLVPEATGAALAGADIDAGDLSSHHDADLGVTLVHLDLAAADRSRSAAQLETLARARDACAVEELVQLASPERVR